MHLGINIFSLPLNHDISLKSLERRISYIFFSWCKHLTISLMRYAVTTFDSFSVLSKFLICHRLLLLFSMLDVKMHKGEVM